MTSASSESWSSARAGQPSRCASRSVPTLEREGIIFSLVTHSGFHDVALRDFDPMLGALTVARVTSVYDPPPLRRRG